MSSTSIRTFNPFNLQHGSNRNWHTLIQEVVYYGESRCRQALTDISKADLRHQTWMQHCLQMELLFIMSFVGLATSLGHVMNVPIILRSLAESLAPVPRADLPIQYDSGLIATLDTGTNVQQHGRIVKSYALAWWKGTRRPAEGGLLDATTLQACIEHYRERLLQNMSGDPVPPVPIIPIPSPQIPTHGHADADPNPQCLHCSKYCSLAADLLNELRSVKNFTSGMAVSTLNNVDIISRRTAGFHIFHEKVQLKEMDQESIHIDGIGPGSRTQKMSRHVRDIAQKALEHVRDMPTGSHKWTWGETLTRDEVLALSGGSNQRRHSGYQLSLRDGQIRGVPSSTNTAPTGTANYSALPAESHIPLPPTSHRLPRYFGSYKSPSPSLLGLESLHISAPTDNPGTSAYRLISAPRPNSAHGPPSAPSPDSDLGADSGAHADTGYVATLADTARWWTHMVDTPDIVGTTAAQSSPPPANLASATQLWIEEAVDTPDIAETTAAQSSPLPSNLASATQLWMEMEGTNTPSLPSIPPHQSAHSPGFADIAQIWLEMDNDADAAEQPPDALAATTQLWLDMDITADSSAHPEEMHVDADSGADPQSTKNDPPNTVSPSKITLSRTFTHHDFQNVPLAWFSDQEPFDADDMSD